MKTLILAAIAALSITSAQAADQSKAEQAATFRLKVATCKADAKANSIKATTPDFYAYMGACIERVNVAVNIGEQK